MSETANPETASPLGGETDDATVVERAVDATNALPQARDALVLMVRARLNDPGTHGLDRVLADVATSHPELFEDKSPTSSDDRDWLRIGSSLRDRLDVQWRRVNATLPRFVGTRAVLSTALVLAGGLAAVAWTMGSLNVDRDQADSALVTSTIGTPSPTRSDSRPGSTGTVPTASLAQSGIVVGVPEILDTTTLRIGKIIIRLDGLDWARGGNADEFREYIAGRSVTCTPVVGKDTFTCVIEGRDLATAVTYNGGAIAKPDAPQHVKEAEAHARGAGTGVWKRAAP